MAKIQIKDIAAARAAGIKYGVTFPEGKGRPPMLKLRDAILAAGDEIIPSDYFSGEFAPRVPVAAPGKAEYEMRQTTMVEYEKNGKTRKRPSVEKFRLNVEEIRNLTQGVGLRGRVSESRALEAFAKHLNKDVTDLEGAKIVRVVEAVRADARPIKAEKASKPAKPTAKPTDPDEAKDLVSVEASQSKDATEDAA